MTVESATYINTLNATYPVSGDQRNEGDNHLRLIKSAVKATFPNITGAVNATHTELNQLAGATALTTATAGQLVLMSATTISGGPSAVDFVNGTGGVVFSTAYDEYLLVLSNIKHGSSGNAKLRLDFSTNAGSAYGAATCEGGSITVTDTTVAGVNHTGLAYYPVMAEHANASATSGGIHMIVRLTRPVGDTTVMGIFSEYIGYTGLSANRSGRSAGRADAAAAIDALRVMWDTGSFANSGTIKLYGRKV